MAAAKNKGGRPAGSLGMNRTVMLNRLAERWPGFDPVLRMIEQAEKARDEMLEQEATRAKQLKARSKRPAPEDMAPRVTLADRNMLQGMYERPARFLIPQLKATELKMGHDGSGKMTVTFERAPAPADKD